MNCERWALDNGLKELNIWRPYGIAGWYTWSYGHHGYKTWEDQIGSLVIMSLSSELQPCIDLFHLAHN
jgi:hypothetical protein